MSTNNLVFQPAPRRDLLCHGLGQRELAARVLPPRLVGVVVLVLVLAGAGAGGCGGGGVEDACCCRTCCPVIGFARAWCYHCCQCLHWLVLSLLVADAVTACIDCSCCIQPFVLRILLQLLLSLLSLLTLCLFNLMIDIGPGLS